MASDDQARTFPFLALPRELRDQIYTHYSAENDNAPCTISNPADRNRFGPSTAQDLTFLPPLCKTSTQLYYEATPLFLRHQTIVLEDRDTIEFSQSWLSSFAENMTPSSAFSGIKDLQIRLYEAWDPYSFRFLKQLVNLQSLELGLNIRQEDCVVIYNYLGKPTSLPESAKGKKLERGEVVQHFVRHNHFSRIVDRLDKLSRFTFYFTASDEEFNFLGFDLKAWLNERWRQRGREVEVAFLEDDNCICGGFMLFD